MKIAVFLSKKMYSQITRTINVTTIKKNKEKGYNTDRTNVYKTPYQPLGQNSPSYPVAKQKPKG